MSNENAMGTFLLKLRGESNYAGMNHLILSVRGKLVMGRIDKETDVTENHVVLQVKNRPFMVRLEAINHASVADAVNGQVRNDGPWIALPSS